MAVLTLLDDGQDTGEEIRVRADRVVIGRTEGEIRIPHDDAVSSRHLELVRVCVQGQYRWHVRDVGSTNGTFARVDEAILQHNQELILGSRRYRFDAAPQGAATATARPGSQERITTSAWHTIPKLEAISLRPALVELAPQGAESRITLSTDDNLLGCDPKQCSAVLPDDPFVSPKHARLYRDKRGRWMLNAIDMVNGVWVRINSIEVTASGQFLFGEQRMTVRIP